MHVWAITGGIASGKSTVTRLFLERGARTASADTDARTVLSDGSPTLAAVLTAFPTAITAESKLDRQRLSAIIFGDPDARQRLNTIMHPAIRQQMRATIEAARLSSDACLLVYEVPLLFEGGLETWFDGVLVAYCSPQQQRERLQARQAAAGLPPLSDQELMERLSAQLPLDQKAQRATVIVRTDTTLEETRRAVDTFWRTICS